MKNSKIIILLLTIIFTLLLTACISSDNTGDDGSNNVSDNSSIFEISVNVGDVVQFDAFKWRVLDVQDSRALLLSDKIIETRAYHDNRVEITWETCDLRDYLNDEFYNSFSADNRARINETRITNDDNQWFGTSGGNDTKDYIFLLSLEEVVKYFGDSGQLASQPDKNTWWIDDQYNSARISSFYNSDSDSVSSWLVWWLRSPAYDGNFAAFVNRDGYISVSGVRDSGGLQLGVDYIEGVRPALWLTLETDSDK